MSAKKRLKTSRTNSKRVISTFKFGYPYLTLVEGPKVKADHTRRFPAHDFLHVGLPSQTSRTNNKRVISTFKFGYARLTLKEGPKVKYDHAKRFPAHDFQYVGIPSQTSRTNNKLVQGLILANFLSTDNQSVNYGPIDPNIDWRLDSYVRNVHTKFG